MGLCDCSIERDIRRARIQREFREEEPMEVEATAAEAQPTLRGTMAAIPARQARSAGEEGAAMERRRGATVGRGRMANRRAMVPDPRSSS